MTNWDRSQQLLLKDSEPIVRALLVENQGRGDIIQAIGFVFEFGRGMLCFEMCANTRQNAEQAHSDFLSHYPDASFDEIRWNSGDYDFPGAVQDHYGGWSEEWWNDLLELDGLAENKKESVMIHDKVADICCNVLAELAKRGTFGDSSNIDFNVATLLDGIEQIKERDRRIRDIIKANA